jgi:hypothetical protein
LITQLFDVFKKKNKGDGQTHPTDMAESEDYSLKPLKDSSFGIKDLDLLETVGEFSIKS